MADKIWTEKLRVSKTEVSSPRSGRYDRFLLTLVNEDNPSIVRHTSIVRHSAVWQRNLLTFFTQAEIDTWGLENAETDLIALLLWDRRVNATVEIISDSSALNGKQRVKELSRV